MADLLISYMTHKSREILVTAALPYANGSLHLGHMVEYIQADIWSRFQRLQGNLCYFVCGSDAHGTPIMLRAEMQNISPEQLIESYNKEHRQDLDEFEVNFDNFYTTHSPENRELASLIYTRLKEKGDIVSRVIRQAYDAEKNMFLPDRYVKGTCPKCSAPDQYGDSCEVCGATYSPTELINPISVLSETPPIEKESEHYFFCLDHYEDFLKEWTHQNHLQSEVAKKLNEWFNTGLKQWDITRDAPYFGFEIPGETNKYFYVWLDAPIGYMASFKNFCERISPVSSEVIFDKFWLDNKNSKNNSSENGTELYHFIGKDIVYFHALFWPALLKGSGFRTPTSIFVHGFLTVNGQKMSKSRGTFITARQYLNSDCPPEFLRYYFACKLGNGIDDIDFQLEDFVQRVNADLVGKLVNIASRTAGFINKNFEGWLSVNCENQALYNQFLNAKEKICHSFEKREYAQAIRDIMHLADEANKYIDEKKPWVLAKNKDNAKLTQEVCTLSLNLFRILMTYLSPILPSLSRKVELFLNAPLTFEAIVQPLSQHKIEIFQPLIQRIELKQVQNMLESSSTQPTHQTINQSINSPVNKNQEAQTTSTNVNSPNTDVNTMSTSISIDDFNKVELRVAKILNAEEVPEAQKLIKLTLDLGNETRQVFAGIKEAYPDPNVLIEKLVVMVANLAPRKMRFGLSEGMVLTSGPGGKDLWILEPNSKAIPGSRIR